MCFHNSKRKESAIKKLSRKSRWRGCLGLGFMIIHTLHSFFSFPAVLAPGQYYPGSLERLHFHLNCFHETDQRNILLFLEQKLLNITLHSNHRDPFLKSFRACDSSNVGRHSEMCILIFFLSLKLLIPNSGFKSQFILNFIYLFLTALHSMWNLSFPTRDRT